MQLAREVGEGRATTGRRDRAGPACRDTTDLERQRTLSRQPVVPSASLVPRTFAPLVPPSRRCPPFLPPFLGPPQVLLYSSIPLAQSAAMSIRDLESSRVSKLVLLTGIITASSKPRVRRRGWSKRPASGGGVGGQGSGDGDTVSRRARATLRGCMAAMQYGRRTHAQACPSLISIGAPPLPLQHKATYLTVQCKTCRGTKRVACSDGMGGAYVPSYCDLANRRAPGAGGEDCGQNPYVILPEQSDFVDQQTLKLQVRRCRW